MVNSIKDTINVRVRNNTALPQNVNILGGTSDPLGVPPSILYQWDLSTEVYFGSVTASIAISTTANPTPVTYTVQVNGYNIESVVFALNTLNFGVFQYSGDIVYVANDFYIYGVLQVGSNPFVSVWNTTNTSGGSSASNQIQLPLVNGGTYNFIVDWGDGNQDTITSWNQAETLHTYTTSGTYSISLTGTIDGFVFGATGDILKILSISNFGNIIFGDSLLGIFSGCTNLSLSSVTDTPDLSTMTRVDNMFEDCTFSSINNLQNWDVSTIVEFESMFRNCVNFNQDISSWNLTSANSLVRMFLGASSFNSPLNTWNVSNVTTMNNMFGSASTFNQSLNSWDVSNVTDMTNMFRFASDFNGNISSWNVSNVTNMSSMFEQCLVFNQNIGSWNVSNVTTMNAMFNGALLFNQNIGSWNVTNVTDMTFMFAGVTAFNQNISTWNVSNVTTMNNMFAGASTFNQNIGGWDVSSVTNMNGMFANATAFNQNIGSWNISIVNNFINFMLGKTNLDYSSANLDAIYNGWSLLTVQPNETINFGTIKYTLAGQAGKNILDFAPNNWTIVDGGI
jgi:surface protein